MTSKRVQALILVAAVAGGYAGAAAYSAWALPSVAVATDFGPGDGLTRYVLTASSGDASGLLAALTATDGVVSAQRLSDGRALVATKGLTPQNLEVLPGIAHAEFSTSVPVLGTITDPYFPQYGYNLDNTGTNSYNSPRVADADVDAPEGWGGGTGNGRIVAVAEPLRADHAVGGGQGVQQGRGVAGGGGEDVAGEAVAGTEVGGDGDRGLGPCRVHGCAGVPRRHGGGQDQRLDPLALHPSPFGRAPSGPSGAVRTG